MNKTTILFILLEICASSQARAVELNGTPEQIFTKIYDLGIYGKDSEGRGTSGSGSTVENTREYVGFLKEFLAEHSIKSVTDLGCGDWEFSRLMDWSQVQYYGYDIVKSVIERNVQRFNAPNIHFVHADGVTTDLPGADLLIVKDLLTHLPESDIRQILAQTGKFKYALFINDLNPLTQKGTNDDVERGYYRTLDLSDSPYSIEGENIFHYRVKDTLGVRKVPYWKQVFLVRGQAEVKKSRYEVIQEMFREMVVKKNAALIPKYYHPDYVLYSNGQQQDYAETVRFHQEIYKTPIQYRFKFDEATVVEEKDRVAFRVFITTSRPGEAAKEIEVILTAQFKQGKIFRIWELTYPDWSKLPAFSE